MRIGSSTVTLGPIPVESSPLPSLEPAVVSTPPVDVRALVTESLSVVAPVGPAVPEPSPETEAEPASSVSAGVASSAAHADAHTRSRSLPLHTRQVVLAIPRA